MSPVSLSLGWVPELLERERELGELKALIADVRAGRGRALVIEGAGGVGKTRLSGALRERAAQMGLRVLAGRGSELEREFAYGVVRQLFPPRLGPGAESGPPAVSEYAPAARSALGLVADSSGSDRGQPELFSTLHGLYLMAADLADQEALLVLVDDAQWADAASLRFLAFLTRRLEELPILLAVATRPPGRDDTGPLVELLADAEVTRVGVGPLSPRAGAQLLASALKDAPDDAFADACHHLTGGNPFLVVELARTLRGEGIAPTAASVSALDDLAPETIARSVLRRLARLPSSARTLARAIAILGDGCESRRACALAGLNTEDGAVGADALRAAEILESEAPLRFLHPLIANTVYVDFPAAARSRAHAAAAALLAEEEEPPERVALHLLATDPAGEVHVSEVLRDGAQTAMDRGAAQLAITYLRRSLREPPPRQTRAEVLEMLLAAAARTADVSALADYEPELYDGLTPDRLMRLAANLGSWLFAAGRLGEATKTLGEAIDAADQVGDLDLAVALEAQLSLITRLPPTQARKRFARYEGRLTENTKEQHLAQAFHAWWGSLLGEPAGKCADLARLALTDRHIFAEALVPAQAILVLARADELDDAGDAAEQMITTATARGSITTLTSGWSLRAYVALRRGDLRSAEADAHQAVSTARLHSFVGAVPPFIAWLIDVLIERDELDAAQRQLELSDMNGKIADGSWLGPVLLSRGKLRLAQGRARESAEDLLELRARTKSWGITASAGLAAAGYAARALGALGDRERALLLAAEELANVKRWGAASWIADATATLGVVTGGQSGVELLTDATRIAHTSPARLIQAATLIELGSALRRERRLVEARKPLRAGLDIARSCAAVGLSRRAAHELQASGEKAPRYTPIGADALTPTEQRVATLAARGMTNRQIAATLFVTIKTVESHLHATYDKLAIRSRTELPDALNSSTSRDRPSPGE